MSLFEKDFIKRSIQQLAKLLSAVLRLRQQGEEEQALQTLRGGVGEVLGVEWRVLVAVDSRSGAELLGTPARIFVFAKLRHEEAEVLEQARDVLGAQQARRHALELYVEALLAGGKLDSDSRAAILALLRTQTGPLDPRHEAPLSALRGQLG